MGAYLLHHNKTGVLKIIFHKATQLVVYIMLFFLIWKGIELPLGSHALYSVLFLVLIMNVSSNPGTMIRLENPLFNYMGKISYGLYMYHVMVILMVLEVLKSRVSFDHLGSQFLLVGLVLLGLTGVASFSYHFFERPFLNFKKRFTLVVSGDDAARTRS
jgi:peptidoglycan/LPS O-acetylase OafA/YrhL